MHRSVFLIFLIFILLLVPAAVQAQAVMIDTMQVDLWPEYDQPEVFVIYRFSLSDSTTLPANITLRIPSSSGGPYNLAYRDLTSSGDINLFNLEYTTSEQDNWILVNFTAPTPDLQLEYYDPDIRRDGDQHAFEFIWPADTTVRSMAVQVQQPRGASEMEIDPPMGAGQVMQDGLTYYNGLFGEIEAGEQFSLTFTYVKPDDTLSQGFEPVFPAEPAPARTTFSNAWPWILGGLGVMMILGIVIWYLVPRRTQKRVPRKRHAPTPPGKVAQGPAGVFCHNCGERSQADDVYCRACGTKLRQ